MCVSPVVSEFSQGEKSHVPAEVKLLAEGVFAKAGWHPGPGAAAGEGPPGPRARSTGAWSAERPLLGSTLQEGQCPPGGPSLSTSSDGLAGRALPRGCVCLLCTRNPHTSLSSERADTGLREVEEESAL